MKTSRDQLLVMEKGLPMIDFTEVCNFIAISKSEASSTSSSDEDSVYDLSNPETGAYDSNDSEQDDPAADPDAQVDPIREGELSTSEEEQSATSHPVGKGNRPKTKEKADPKGKGKANLKTDMTTDQKQESKFKNN